MTRFFRLSGTLTLTAALWVGLLSPPLHAAELPPAAAKNPIVVYTRLAPAGAEDGPGRALLELIDGDRTLRVIVGLDFDMAPAHFLSEGDAATQAADLAEFQAAVLQRILGSNRTGAILRFRDIPFMTLEVNKSQLRKVLVDPGVTSVQEDTVAAPMLRDSTQTIRATQVWALKPELRGAGQAIAILDTGTNHATMLKDRIVAGACYSTNYPAYTAESLCAGGATSRTGKSAGSNCPTYIRGCDHGTHVATIAAGDDGSLRGVAREAGIIRIQVFTKFSHPAYCGSGSCVMAFTSNLIQALEQVYRLRNSYDIAAVNMSLGGGIYRSHCDASQPAMAAIINQLTSAGIAVVVASGNSGRDGYISWPACINNAIAVGCTTDNDNLAYFSNHSNLIDLLAPGYGIYAGVPSRSYGYKSGTSMAAPHVAGAFALLKSYDPNASVAELLTALDCTGEPITRAGVSRNRIDMRSAYQFLKKSETSCKKVEDYTLPEWVPRHRWF